MPDPPCSEQLRLTKPDPEMTKDPYAALGVRKTASDAEIKKASAAGPEQALPEKLPGRPIQSAH